MKMAVVSLAGNHDGRKTEFSKMVRHEAKHRKSKRRIIELVGGPGDGVKLESPPCWQNGHPCKECGGTVIIQPPEPTSRRLVYRARPGDWTKADFVAVAEEAAR
jgi:hypothetical protein